MPDDAPAATPIYQRSPLLVALAGFATTALLWFVLRAYTGVFDVLNLRIVVGAIAIVPALAPLFVAKEKSTNVSILTSACTVGSILGGEALATVVTGRDIPWSTFIVGFVAAAAILPFTKSLRAV